MRLENKVAIVTGGARGIGKAIVKAFVKEGADVAIADIDIETAKASAEELSKLGRRVIAVHVDVADEGLVDKMVDKVIAEFGHVDILVNDAGITSFYQLLDLPVEVFDRTIAVNLRGPFLCTRKVAKHMVEKKIRGNVINITSIGGEVACEIDAHYTASKGGLKMMTKSMALSLAKYKIRVNGIAPGPVPSPIATTMEKIPNAASQEYVMSRIPIGRPGLPKDIANAAVFLASDESSFMLGSIVIVDGGVTSLGLIKRYEYD
jgi:NAD(P)-dependent dehydrogenase (short-subunit alcohol dehydrogenase family)